METLRWINLTARFLLELCAIAAAAEWGWHVADGSLIGAVLATIAALTVVGVWGVFVAPKSRRRLPDPGRLVLEFVIFGLAGAALVVSGWPTLGIALALLAWANAVLVRVLGGEPV